MFISNAQLIKKNAVLSDELEKEKKAREKREEERSKAEKEADAMSLVFSNNVVCAKGELFVRKIRNHFGPIMDPFTTYHHCKWTATKPNKPTIFSAQ